MAESSSSPQEEEEEEKKDASEATCSQGIVPQLQAHGVTFQDLETAVKVLRAVATLPSPSRNRQQPNRKQQKRKAAAEAAEEAAEALAAGPSSEIQNNGDDSAEQEQDWGVSAYQHAHLRPLRKALAGCLDLHQQTMYNGQTEHEHYQQRIEERTLKRQRKAEKDRQKNYIATTQLRKGRVERLRALQQDAQEEERGKIIMALMIPDGHVDTTTTTTTTTTTAATSYCKMLTENGEAVDDSPLQQQQQQQQQQEEEQQPSVQLPLLRSCYVCKVRYRELHSFYDQLCPPCAALNWTKRMQTADLSGRVAVVTGSRVKIGYQVCLKLLRAGATVIATTRFPNAAVAAYRQEADFDAWCHRLHVYGLDLRDVAGLEAFVRFLKHRYADKGIDVLINNACQTIRRPAGYYRPLLEQEQELWKTADQTHQNVLQGCREFEQVRRRIVLDHHKQQHCAANGPTLELLPEPVEQQHLGEKPAPIDAKVVEPVVTGTALESTSLAISSESVTAPFETTGLSHSAAMSQMIILPDDVGVHDDILPPGISDVNGQQLDLRTKNSWLLKMEEVSTPELMECMFVNAIAPFVLNSRLKPLMTVPTEDRPDRYIINVSAMEGKFYRFKTECHPHTNMAKASLNMLTRTSAENLAKQHRIFMNSVDTGWINDENPLERASRTAKNNLFQTPIDEIDAAARILDPIFTGVVGGPEQEKVFGKFLKDYKESEW